MADGKNHISIVICGHVDAGKSTTTGRLLFELGDLDPRLLEKLTAIAKENGKESFKYAYVMDTQKDERERGVTISCQTKEFFTEKFHYTIVDAPGHRDYVGNMIRGSSQVDIALLMVPADGFITALSDGKDGGVKGQTREHAMLLNLLGVKQLIIGVNKMDSDSGTGPYSEEKYNEVCAEMRRTLKKVGWKPDVADNVPIIPMSGFNGDNLIEKSTKMPWWTGVDVKVGSDTVKVHTLLDALNDMARLPERKPDAPARVPISAVIKKNGLIVCGRVEQGSIKPEDKVTFLPTHTATNPCSGRIFSIEMHHKNVTSAGTGDNVGMMIKLDKESQKPMEGDVMVLSSDKSLKTPKGFTAQIQVLDHPGQLKVGYCPVAYCRTAKSACRIAKINWKIGRKSTGGKKLEDPAYVEANDMAEVVFEPMQPFVVESFKDCEGLSRIAIMEGKNAVMLGKAVSTSQELVNPKK